MNILTYLQTKCTRGWRVLFPPQTLGQRGERAAERFLKRKGYRIVARGARNAFGELDLVGVEGQTVVFIEVKTRQSDEPDTPEEAVNFDKQRRLTRLAIGFMKRHGLLEYSARFDVVAVVWPAAERKPTIRHIANAFDAVGKGDLFA